MDLVHRFVLHQLFENVCRGFPANAAQFEKADIEPVGQLRLQLGFQHPQLRLRLEHIKQLGAQCHQKTHAAKGRAEQTDHLGTRRLHRLTQLHLGLPLPFAACARGIAGVRRVHARGIRPQLHRQHRQRLYARRRVHLAIERNEANGARARGNRPALLACTGLALTPPGAQ